MINQNGFISQNPYSHINNININHNLRHSKKQSQNNPILDMNSDSKQTKIEHRLNSTEKKRKRSPNLTPSSRINKRGTSKSELKQRTPFQILDDNVVKKRVNLDVRNSYNSQISSKTKKKTQNK